MAFTLPEKYRIDHQLYPKSMQDPGSGAFLLPGLKIGPIKLFCIASQGDGWEHVSVTLQNLAAKKHVPRCPGWVEMCNVRDTFWGTDQWVAQYHPPASEYINNHPYCLHLWRPTQQQLATPPSIMVGLKGLNL